MSGYTFHPSVGGIFAEVYLPKKAHFQGVLYDSLTDGFDIKKVRAHFRDEKHKAEIKKILRFYYPQLADYTNKDINQFPDVFYGYSMYEVDGVFAAKPKGKILIWPAPGFVDTRLS